MKKWFLYAAALLVFCGCDDKNDPVDGPAADKVSVAPTEETFDSKGGSVPVQVTSSGKWSLTGEYDWVSPSVLWGEDGEIVTFTVEPNETDGDLTAEYVFTVGKATAKFTIVCKKPGVVVDRVSVAPGEGTVENTGGDVEVTVTSSGTWTLTGEAAWAHPSATTGVDGDKVVFAVDPNEDAEDKTVEYTFTVGEDSVPFTLTSKSNPRFIELVSAANVTLPYTKGEIEVKVNSNIPYRELEHEVVVAEGGDASWLKHVVTLGDGATGAKLMYEVEAYAGIDDNRTATIVIKGAGGAKAEVIVVQKPQPYITLEKTFYYLELAGGTIDIPVVTNLEYEVLISESGAGWLAHTGVVDGKEHFTVAAATEKREARITIKEKNGEFNKTVDVFQQAQGAISVAANMANNRAWPLWNNPAPVTNMSTMTVEALIYGETWTNNVTTILGIEDHFLIRVGDGNPKNRLQVATASGGGWNPERLAVYSNDTYLDTKKWYHLAVTFNAGVITIYLNGVQAATGTNSKMKTVNFGVAHNDEAGPTITRCFWVGYSFESLRYLNGMLSEVRIWNKVLTPEEINAPNHFYGVSPESDGLVTYWKFNEGKGKTVKDWTSYGNDLTADKDLNWVPISLP